MKNTYFYIPVKGKSKKKFVGGVVALAGLGLQMYQAHKQNKANKEAMDLEEDRMLEQERKQELELERQQTALDQAELDKYPTRGYNIEGFYAKGGRLISKRKNRKLGRVVNTDAQETPIAVNAMQVNTNEKGTDKIDATIAGEPGYKLDNNEVVVKDSQGRIVVISDDLGEASKYRYEVKQAQNNPRLQQIINNKYAKRAIALEQTQGKNKWAGGNTDIPPFVMPNRNWYPNNATRIGLRYRTGENPSYNAIEEDLSPIVPEPTPGFTNYYGDATLKARGLGFSNPIPPNNGKPRLINVGKSIFDEYPVNEYPYNNPERASDINVNPATSGVDTKTISTPSSSIGDSRGNASIPKKSISNSKVTSKQPSTINKTTPSRFTIGSIPDEVYKLDREGLPISNMPSLTATTISSPELPSDNPLYKNEVPQYSRHGNNPFKNIGFNQIASGIGQAGQLGLGIYNMVQNEEARKRLSNIKYPEFKYPRYKNIDVDVNRPEYEQQVSDLRSDQRSMESLIKRGSTSSQDALARIAASRLGTGRNINRAFSSYITKKGGLENLDTQQRNQFMTNRAMAEMGHDQMAYQDKINRINTGLALTGSSINSIQGFLTNLEKGIYQSEELKAIGASLGVKFSGYESTNEMINKIKQATLTQPLKEIN